MGDRSRDEKNRPWHGQIGNGSSGRRGASALQRLGRRLVVVALSFGGGVVALLIVQARSGPPLEVWHKVELTSEFKAKGRPEVRSFEEYLRLEERLFAELDRKVYDRTASGPAYALARYSAGSGADPRGRHPDWNRSFELSGDDSGAGVLLLHGMSDSPYSLRALAQSLHQRGHWVVGVRMPGHGTVPSGLRGIAWEDLAAAARLAMEHLASRVGPRPIHVIGYSTGALLALNYVLDLRRGESGPEPASLVLISPAMGIGPIAALAGWVNHLARLPGLGKLAWESIRPEFDPHKYNSFSTNAGHQVHRLVSTVASRIEEAADSVSREPLPPTLVFLSAVDATVSVDAVIDNLLRKLAAGRHELFLFDINRSSVRSTVLVADPGPLTARLLEDPALPFHLSLVTNENPASSAVVLRRKTPFSAVASSLSLGLEWPPGLISLSHIALQFPPDDPLYGHRPAHSEAVLHLGQMAIQGERGLLRFPTDWLLRVRHNPFYTVLEERVLERVGGSVEESGAIR